MYGPLVYGLGLEFRQAVPVSLIVVGAAALSGAIPKIRAGQVDWRLAAAFAGAAVVASLVAGHLGTRMETDRLRRWFAWLVFVVATYVLVDTQFLR